MVRASSIRSATKKRQKYYAFLPRRLGDVAGSLSATSGTLHFHLMVYVTNVVAFAPNLGLSKAPNNYESSIGMGVDTALDSIRLWNGAGSPDQFYYSPTLFGAFKTNTWMHWEIIHTIGTSNVTAKIDGVSDTFTATRSFGSSFGSIFVNGATGKGAFWIDAAMIPEPIVAGTVVTIR
jgi:hypothetical protein